MGNVATSIRTIGGGLPCVPGARNARERSEYPPQQRRRLNAPGIVAIYDALVADGHKVTIVAPSGNRSGSSAALTFGPFQVDKIASNIYSLEGTPANTVKFGAWLLTGPNAPDLVVSRINSGANIGPSTVISGTVGNVITVIEEVDKLYTRNCFSTD